MSVLSLNDDSAFLAELQRVVFRGFYLSQGNMNLHWFLSQYVALQRDWSLSADQIARLYERLVPMCNAFVAGGWHQPYDGALIEYEVRRQLDWLSQAFARRDRLWKREDLLAGIIEHCLRGDFEFLCERGGRPRAAQTQQTMGTAHAPFFSHLCHYGLLHKPTGVTVFDALFTEIALVFEQRTAIFERSFAVEPTRYRLTQVIAVHNRHYPEQPVPTSWFA